jgi:hypothetical protein
MEEEVRERLRHLEAETLAYSAVFAALMSRLGGLNPEMKVLCSEAMKEAITLLDLSAKVSGPGAVAANAVLATDKIEQLRIMIDPGKQQPRHAV